ncbi:MAG: FecCD family ABC transporter permease [Schwartzia sp. (in: firmicutes)]
MREENVRNPRREARQAASTAPASTAVPSGHDTDGQKVYQAITQKKVLVVLLLLLGTAAGFVLNLIAGSSDIGLREAAVVLTGGSVDPTTDTVIRSIRLPMAVMAVLAGVAFAVGGCEMQTILGNPMASPYTLGISAAAAFGAAAGIVLQVNIDLLPPNLVVTANAFGFSLVAAFLIYRFAAWRASSRNTIILFGIALNFIFNSLTMFLQYIADENKLQSLVFWTFGSLAKASWDKALLLFAITLLTLVFLYRRAWQLTALVLQDARALSLGVNVPRLRRQVVILISLLTATTVSFVGTIGFLGLAAPHLARGLVGEDHRYLLPASALFGAFLLSMASLLSKVLIPGTLLPIGLITSLLGIPFFMLLIFTAGRRYT